ncbi:glycoside hydrolase family 19 protein [Burkholderia cenocepacia]|uniref:glycoside hydrolase family 19 protein n=1 Tax=Burkholderia cenocepacia TaxID=95486 RepID=UPI001BA03A84|nr:glycoside hydrolase family 19 protein [Burkholderia cenocepacia]MBR8374644.1 glycoside hydrolase family 19 protein [Burkholderia cenocepacia]
MANQSVPKQPQAPTPAPVKLKPLSFAFPFLRKEQGKSEASAQFTDEHEIYRLLAERESSGAYLVSRKGMWHGGIHVTEAGAGQSLDLDAGLRCIADGTLIAFRANKTYPVSELGEAGSETPVQAPYSTGFALVRHMMEFPRDTKLTFYSLYMHLMSWEDYANFPKRSKPSYWPRQWQVTQYAQDQPSPGRNGQVPDASEQGLRIRKTPNGVPLGVLPQGAKVGIGKIEMKRGKPWGQLTDIHGALPYPQEAGGYVEPSSVIGKWVYLGQENGGSVAEEVVEDTMFDRVVVVTDQANPSNPPGIPIKAGDLIGHLGRYDSLNERTSGTRMAHIEVLCDDGIQLFLEQGRTWVNQHGPQKENWTALGLPSEPTILRIAPGTVLYQRTQDDKFVPGADPQSRKTDAVQVYSLAELARDSNRRVPEKHPNPNPGYPVNWWHVEGVNALGQPIDGWVCDFNFPGGRVTREFAQKWVDFECLADSHDPAHTIFATTRKWAEYASGDNVADLASRSNISPLMLKVYDALFKKGDGKQAADELCTLSQTGRGGYPWLMQAASRLIVKHESEWANPSKWKQLIAELEKQTGPKPQHEEERKRIDKLAWWDDVKAHIPDFPSPEIYHVHPVGLVANFQFESQLITLAMLVAVEPSNSIEYHQSILPHLNKYAAIYKVNKPKRIAHFLSQSAHESHLRASEEGLNYSPRNMRKTFGCKGGKKNYDEKCDDCKRGRLREKLWSQEAYYAHNPEHLANYVYANRMGNGDEDSGDGYKYRGRGFIQVTGKEGYQSFSNEHDLRSPDDKQDFVKNPELVASQLEYSVESAFVFWARNNLNSISDGGSVSAVTQIVNGGQTGYDDRRGRYNRVAPLLGLSVE